MIGAHLRYRYAFSRMDEAMEEGWLMEAITIQESILSGRLLSVLHSKGIAVNPRDSFSSLIDRFKRYVEDDDPHVAALVMQLHEWRIKRNEALHSVCRHIDDPYDEDTVSKCLPSGLNCTECNLAKFLFSITLYTLDKSGLLLNRILSA